jgi:hypothetical protein
MSLSSLAMACQSKMKSLLNPPTVELEPGMYLKLSWFIISITGQGTAFL